MQLTLKAELELYIDQQVRSGRYHSAEDLLTAAVERMKQEERIEQFAPGELDGLIAVGERDLKTGNTVTIHEAKAHFNLKARGS